MPMQRKQRKWLFTKYNLSTAATATTVLLWWLGRKWCSMPTTGCCVKIPEPKRANSKNKQRFYKELTRRGHSKVKLSQAHFFTSLSQQQQSLDKNVIARCFAEGEDRILIRTHSKFPDPLQIHHCWFLSDQVSIHKMIDPWVWGSGLKD